MLPFRGALANLPQCPPGPQPLSFKIHLAIQFQNNILKKVTIYKIKFYINANFLPNNGVEIHPPPSLA